MLRDVPGFLSAMDDEAKPMGSKKRKMRRSVMATIDTRMTWGCALVMSTIVGGCCPDGWVVAINGVDVGLMLVLVFVMW